MCLFMAYDGCMMFLWETVEALECDTPKGMSMLMAQYELHVVMERMPCKLQISIKRVWITREMEKFCMLQDI